VIVPVAPPIEVTPLAVPEILYIVDPIWIDVRLVNAVPLGLAVTGFVTDNILLSLIVKEGCKVIAPVLPPIEATPAEVPPPEVLRV
jgi:hypothetical protein